MSTSMSRSGFAFHPFAAALLGVAALMLLGYPIASVLLAVSGATIVVACRSRFKADLELRGAGLAVFALCLNLAVLAIAVVPHAISLLLIALGGVLQGS